MGLPGNRPRYKAFLDFSGGQNDTDSEIKLRTDEGSEFRNVDLDRDGAVSSRKGSILLATGAGYCGLLTHFFPTGGSPVIIGAFGTKVQTFSSPNWVDLLTGLTSGLQWLEVPFRDRIYLFNGVDVPVVYWPAAPSTPLAYRPGAPQPVTAPSGGTDIAGVLTAGHKFKLRIRYESIGDETFISDPYPEAGVEFTVGASGGLRVTIPVYPAPGGIDFRVVARVIERTTAGVSSGGVFFREGRVGDNTSTTWDVVGPDGALDELLPDPTFRRVTPKLYPVILHRNRIMGADVDNPGVWRWSEIDEFGVIIEAFPDDNTHVLDIQDASDLPIAAASLGDFVVIYCGRSVHVFSVDEGGNSFAQKLFGHELGVPGPRCVVELPGGHLIWTFAGPYFFNRQEMIFAGEKIETEIGKASKSLLSKMFTVHRTQERRRQVKFVVPGAGATDARAMVYHYRRRTLAPQGEPVVHAWTFYDNFDATAGLKTRDATSRVDVEYSGDRTGKFYQEESGFSDAHIADGSIPAAFVSAWLDMGEPHIVKEFTDAWIFLAGQSTTLGVAWELSFGAGAGGAGSAAVAAGLSSRWGTAGPPLIEGARWGTATWAIGSMRVLRVPLAQAGISAVGRYIRFRMTAAPQNQPFTVVGLIVKYSGDRDEEGRG